MAENTHTVTGIYHTEELAHQVLARLRDGGFPEKRLRIIGPHDPMKGRKLKPKGKAVASEIIKDTLIGTGLGGAAGAAGSALFALANTAVFMTNPVMGALMITGYAATVGGTIGALKGVSLKETAYLGVVEDALNKGYWVVAVHTQDDQEKDRAGGIIGESVVEI